MNLLPNQRIIFENILISIAGNVAPMLFAIACIPYTIHGIGNEKFGILSIAWLFLGYFSILDLGIGRATTKFVIEYYNKGLVNETKSLITASIGSLMLLGILLAGILYALTPLLIEDYLNIPTYLYSETHKSLYAISVSIPFIIGISGLRGVLEARQKFRLLNIIKIPASVLNYLVPAIVATYTDHVFLIILWLLIMRILLFFIHAYYCFAPFELMGSFTKVDTKLLKRIVGYGGWLTISNVIGPVMVYLDRFIIGSILTLTLLTYYSTPYEVITKLLVVSGSATIVLFPVFTNLFYLKDMGKFQDVYKRSIKGIVVLLFPVTLLITCFAFEILSLWLGKAFAINSSVVLQLLSIGVLCASISSIPFTALQALNRPDLTAKVHIVELPFYLAGLYLFAHDLGIAGVALVWMIRNMFDAGAFLLLHKRIISMGFENKEQILSLLLIFCISSFAGAALLTIYGSIYYKIVYSICVLSFFFLFVWKQGLSLEEKGLISTLLKKVMHKIDYGNRA